MVAGTAQNCGAGVKIYGYVPGAAEEITEGDQVPVSAGTLFEEAGKPGTAPLWQIGAICVKAGTIGVLTTTRVVAVPLQLGVV